MTRLLLLVTVPLALVACRSHVPDTPEPALNEARILTLETSRDEASGVAANAGASIGDRTIGGDLTGNTGRAANGKMTAIDSPTLAIMMDDPEWTLEIDAGSLKARRDAKPRLSSHLPLDVDKNHKFMSSRTAGLRARLSKAGVLEGTFWLENDAFSIPFSDQSFGATAIVNLLSSKGEVLESLHVAEQRIDGKPGGEGGQKGIPRSTDRAEQRGFE